MKSEAASLYKAKRKLESELVSHTSACPAEDLTGWPAPCLCGADEKNEPIRSAIDKIDEAIKGLRTGK